REAPRFEVQADLGLAPVVELLPRRRAVDRDEVVGEAERVFEVDLLRPVNALVGVPLLILALLVQREQLVAPFVVLPVEDRRDFAGRNPPLGLLDRQRVYACAHRSGAPRDERSCRGMKTAERVTLRRGRVKQAMPS